jgi:hypothetical protein
MVYFWGKCPKIPQMVNVSMDVMVVHHPVHHVEEGVINAKTQIVKEISGINFIILYIKTVACIGR